MARLDFIANGDNFITSNGFQYRVVGDRPIDIESIDIELYQTNDDPKTVRKNLFAHATLKGTLRSETSFINPTITILSGTPFYWNYAYIPIMQRYYFITDVRVIRKTLYEVSMRCDVLMTYQNEILNLETRVLRSESNHNWDYTDTLPPTKGKTNISVIHAGEPVQGRWETPLSYPLGSVSGSGYFQIKLACNTVNNGSPRFGYIYMTLPYRGFGDLIARINALGIFAGSYKITDVILEAKWIPCGWIGTLDSEYINEIGYRGWSGLRDEMDSPWGLNAYYYTGVNPLGFRKLIRWRMANPLRAKNYLNRPPFKTMAIAFAPFGTISIDSEKWGQSENIYIGAETDPISGNSLLYISDDWNSYNEKKEMIGSANVAIPIDMVALQSNISAIASSTVSAISALVPKSISSPTHFVSSRMATIVDHIGNTLSHPPTFASVCGSGNGDGLMDYRPHLVVGTVEQPDPNLKTQGWLLNKDVRLSNLHGYCLCDRSIHIEGGNLAIATRPEIDEIESLLTSGVILP